MKLRPLAVTTSLLLCASLTLAACGGGGDDGSAMKQGGTLVVLGSSPDINSAWQQNIDQQFEARTGAKIQWLPGAAPTNLTKLITSKGGRPPADVVFLDTPTQTQAIQAGVLEKLDRSKLTDSGPQLPPSAYANEGYGPAAIVIRLGTCANTAQLKKAGIDLPESVDDWFNPALKGHFAMPDISTFYTQATLPALAKNANVPLDNPAGFLDKIQEASPSTFWTSTADVQQSLQAGQVWVSPLLDGRCLNLALKGEPVAFQPLNLNIDGKKYRYVGLFDTWDLVKGTEKNELAEAFIDIAVNEKSMSTLQQKFGYLPARTDLLAKAKQDPALKDMVGDYNPDDLYVPDYKEWFDKYAASWQDAWNQKFKK